MGKVWEETGSLIELNDLIHSHLPKDKKKFICSSKGDKMLLLDLYPSKFRKYIENDKLDLLYLDFEYLIKKNHKLDIAFDLLEWLFLGFDRNDILTSLLKILTNEKFNFDETFFTKWKFYYEIEASS